MFGFAYSTRSTAMATAPRRSRRQSPSGNTLMHRPPHRALDAIRNRTYMVGWPRYLATARREEGRLAALTGDQRGAVRSYEEYLALRAGAEAPVKAQDESLRATLGWRRR